MSDAIATRIDRMRYTKNTASSRLALLAIVFDILFFISIYKSDVGTYYYTITIGASIIYNLVFLLAAFLCSEGVKNYRIGYSWARIVLGIVQIARIFILPMNAHGANYHFDRSGDLYTLRLKLGREEALPSISGLCFAALLVENEIQDLFGITVTGLVLDYHQHLLLTKEAPAKPFCRVPGVSVSTVESGKGGDK